MDAAAVADAAAAPPADEPCPAASRISPLSPCATAGRPDTVQGELSLIGSCFEEAVAVLDDEPDAQETLPAFFDRARSRMESCAIPVPRGFSALRRTPSGEALQVSDGAVVAAASTDESRDLYDDGREEVTIVWRFSAAGHAETGTATLTLSFGGGAE
jgi:hypothetical protein